MYSYAVLFILMVILQLTGVSRIPLIDGYFVDITFVIVFLLAVSKQRWLGCIASLIWVGLQYLLYPQVVWSCLIVGPLAEALRDRYGTVHVVLLTGVVYTLFNLFLFPTAIGLAKSVFEVSFCLTIIVFVTYQVKKYARGVDYRVHLPEPFYVFEEKRPPEDLPGR